MTLTIFLIVAPIVTILVFWRHRTKSMRKDQDTQTDFLKELDEDETPPWEDPDDSKNS